MAALAALYTRARLPQVSLQILQPIIYPVKRYVKEAEPKEVAEYSAALLSVGANSEALALLKNVDRTRFPRADFYEALIRMNEWNYALTIELLERYLTREPDDYAKFTAKLNLVQALLYFKRYSQAESLLTEIHVFAKIHSFPMKEGNVCRYRGVLDFLAGNYKKAIPHLEKAKSLLEPAGGIDYFLARKWWSLTQYFCSPFDAAHTLLTPIRREAFRLRHWETIRDLDFHQAVKENNEELFRKLYFGTPYPSFKERLVKEFSQFSLPSQFHLNHGGGGTVPLIYPRLNEEAKTKGKNALDKLLGVLASDLYRPFRLVALFDRIYTGQKYFPTASEQRIYQLLKRLRQEIEHKKLPFQIKMFQGEYRLRITRPCRLVLSGMDGRDSFEKRLDLLRTVSSETITLPSTIRLLGLGKTEVGEFLKEAVDRGFLCRSGKGRATRYSFRSSQKKAA